MEKEWMDLVELAMKSNVSKDDFRKFLETKRQELNK
ncbi:DNA-binding anti-repressor SinI [Neobacillus niacini]